MYNDNDTSYRIIDEDEFNQAKSLYDLPVFMELLRRESFRRGMEYMGNSWIVEEYDNMFPDRVILPIWAQCRLDSLTPIP